MKITKTQNGNSLYLALEGRLDTNTAPELENTRIRHRSLKRPSKVPLTEWKN